MIHQYELKAEDVRAYTLQTMKEHLAIPAAGYCCTTEMIFDVSGEENQLGEQGKEETSARRARTGVKTAPTNG